MVKNLRKSAQSVYKICFYRSRRQAANLQIKARGQIAPRAENCQKIFRTSHVRPALGTINRRAHEYGTVEHSKSGAFKAPKIRVCVRVQDKTIQNHGAILPEKSTARQTRHMVFAFVMTVGKMGACQFLVALNAHANRPKNALGVDPRRLRFPLSGNLAMRWILLCKLATSKFTSAYMTGFLEAWAMRMKS
ncbi:MAG: hypothetical protein R2911_30575 [Caldilineaceae bacterium]